MAVTPAYSAGLFASSFANTLNCLPHVAQAHRLFVRYRYIELLFEIEDERERVERCHANLFKGCVELYLLHRHPLRFRNCGDNFFFD